jgi:hypothetical protein
MRLAYATADEVNRALATQMAAECGAVVCHVRPGDAPPEGLFDAVLYNLDDVPSDQHAAFLDGFCHDPPVRPTAVHGYGLADEQADTLRRHGVAAAQRLNLRLFRSLCKAVRKTRASVLDADALTWINLVE